MSSLPAPEACSITIIGLFNKIQTQPIKNMLIAITNYYRFNKIANHNETLSLPMRISNLFHGSRSTNSHLILGAPSRILQISSILNKLNFLHHIFYYIITYLLSSMPTKPCHPPCNLTFSLEDNYLKLFSSASFSETLLLCETFRVTSREKRVFP